MFETVCKFEKDEVMEAWFIFVGRLLINCPVNVA